MTTYTVSGGLAGYHNPAADEVTQTEKFCFAGLSREVALAKAQEMAAQLRPGGVVIAFEEVANPFNCLGENIFYRDCPLPTEWVNEPAK